MINYTGPHISMDQTFLIAILMSITATRPTLSMGSKCCHLALLLLDPIIVVVFMLINPL